MKKIVDSLVRTPKSAETGRFIENGPLETAIHGLLWGSASNRTGSKGFLRGSHC